MKKNCELLSTCELKKKNQRISLEMEYSGSDYGEERGTRTTDQFDILSQTICLLLP